MLDLVQIKVIQYLATGHTVKDTAEVCGIKTQDIYYWKRNSEEFGKELSNATDLFANTCLKERSRSYRAIAKKIQDKILDKIDDEKLDDYDIMDLLKMNEKVVGSMNNDENAKKLASLTAIQNNLTINNTGTTDKLNNPDIIKAFGKFLGDIGPDGVESIVDAQNRVDAKNAQD